MRFSSKTAWFHSTFSDQGTATTTHGYGLPSKGNSTDE
jgi:hypothetical protein